MASSAQITSAIAVPQRRLTLTPIAFDLVLALSQTSEGLRLGELAGHVGGAVSSVQSALRVLVANQLVVRRGCEPPAYTLDRSHRATSALVGLAAVLPEPERAMEIAARANPAVAFASVDRQGVVVVLAADADPADVAVLGSTIDLVEAGHQRGHAIQRISAADLPGLMATDATLWKRLVDAVRLKGHIPVFAPGAARS